ncbi:hypothetical protein GCM10009841_25440 [Microlunatus panaciterrae]|uniref:Integral membrane protein n=1 Tax=Microlunatus panaciterrae TaxID=400768 RepID=A0ABS2REL0_9ACTN|nr:hypothetical protein [Microlunatus panaciterrae]MBM7797426.1 hypothetical protein [Microlunatus panaciterrae]
MRAQIPTSRTRPLVLAAVLMAVEAVAAIAFGVAEASHIRASRLVVGLGTTLLMVGYGTVLALVARGVISARRWSRGPAVATQLLHLPLAWNFLGGGTWWVSVLLASVSLTALVCLILPSSTQVLMDSSAGRDQD